MKAVCSFKRMFRVGLNGIFGWSSLKLGPVLVEFTKPVSAISIK